jgi:hypothetical protein
MSTATEIYEVLLIHAELDEISGREVRAALVESGFSVISSLEIVRSERLIGDRLRKAIIGADAVVFLFSPASDDRLLLLQLGAASALEKPIFIVRSGVSVDDLPTYARKFPSFPISHPEEIVASLRSQQQSDSADWEVWRETLEHYYKKKKVASISALEADYQQLESIAKGISKSSRLGREVSADDVYYRLLRMQKLGLLPDEK